MGAVLLDTTVLIDLLRGRGGARRRLAAMHEAGDDPYVCAVNVEEIVRGLRGKRELGAARSLVAGLRPSPLGASQGWQAGKWRREFAREGRTLSQADCLIAAAATTTGAALATGNPRDFPMAELAVLHWPAGEE